MVLWVGHPLDPSPSSFRLPEPVSPPSAAQVEEVLLYHSGEGQRLWLKVGPLTVLILWLCRGWVLVNT